MFQNPVLRIFVILLWFIVCTACGKPADTQGQADTGEDGVLAGDVNSLGGGTAAPDIPKEEEPYHSPVLSEGPPPTTLTTASSIDQAVKLAGGDRKWQIMAWFTSDDCVECPAIERDIFNDPEVIKASKNWIYVFIDVDKNPERAEYMLAGGDPPAFAALDRMGYVYKRKIGVVTKAEYLDMLQTWQ